MDVLKSIVGPDGWTEGADAAPYLDDPRDRFRGQSTLVLRPRSTRQVSEIVKACAAHRVGIVPYSGGTGVVAGQLSIDDPSRVVLSLDRMTAIRSMEIDDAAMVVEAGCLLADVQKAADEAGFLFPLSMASEGSCRIGGNLATNAGGIQVLRYGNTRDLCLGLEAVLPDGSVFSELSALHKNNTGYDLRHLLIGSEGTLGIITAATMKLVPRPAERVTLLCGLNDPAQAVALLRRLRAALGDGLSAFELLSDVGLTILRRQFPGEATPLQTRSQWYVLIEAGGSTGLRQSIEETLADALEAGLIGDAVVAESVAQTQAIWRLREMMPEANRLSGAICNSDTSVPISRIARFIKTTIETVHSIDPHLTVNCYGHVGDGNIHCNVLPPPGVSKAEMLRAHPDRIEKIRLSITEATVACRGAISAEHGIGRLKLSDLDIFGDPIKLAAMRHIKQGLDPDNIMNPGVFFAKMRNTTINPMSDA